MAEALNSLFKAELVRGPARRGKGLWRGIDELEIAVVEWVDWYNQRRLHSELGYLPPVEYEAAYWARHATSSAESHSTAGEVNDDDHTATHDQTNPVLAATETN